MSDLPPADRAAVICKLREQRGRAEQLREEIRDLIVSAQQQLSSLTALVQKAEQSLSRLDSYR